MSFSTRPEANAPFSNETLRECGRLRQASLHLRSLYMVHLHPELVLLRALKSKLAQ
ncbi:MAG: hypothetical protein V7K48_32575 [Nostoc sp.]|uniref:hypothetical protein n=1 Tax=Nostoc sp. TaxID=1180 RepID=UPI002FF6F363